MISVAMATYNGEKYIKEQLDSILAQTILPDQIVVSDDCSSDETISILHRYSEQHPEIEWIILENKHNQGYVKNFFSAMKACSKDVIILCDQDDIWKREKVEKINEFFSDPEVLSVHGDIDVVDMEGKTIRSNAIGYKSAKRKMPIEEFFRHLYYCGMSSAFRSSLLPAILSIDPENLPTHDWLVHAAAVCEDGFYTSSEVLSLRRFHGDNVALNLEKTTRGGIQQRIDVVEYYCWHYKLLNELYRDFGLDREKFKLTEKILKVNNRRLKYLKERSLRDAIINAIYLKYYPTKKSYVSDLLYLINVF